MFVPHFDVGGDVGSCVAGDNDGCNENRLTGCYLSLHQKAVKSNQQCQLTVSDGSLVGLDVGCVIEGVMLGEIVGTAVKAQSRNGFQDNF